MVILVWNVRGLSKKVRRQDVKDHVHRFSPSTVGLVETKERPNKAYRVTKSLPVDRQHVNNYAYSDKGIIWLSWNTNIWSCTVISMTLLYYANY